MTRRNYFPIFHQLHRDGGIGLRKVIFFFLLAQRLICCRYEAEFFINDEENIGSRQQCCYYYYCIFSSIAYLSTTMVTQNHQPDKDKNRKKENHDLYYLFQTVVSSTNIKHIEREIGKEKKMNDGKLLYPRLKDKALFLVPVPIKF
jgi:hypothetical protein